MRPDLGRGSGADEGERLQPASVMATLVPKGNCPSRLTSPLVVFMVDDEEKGFPLPGERTMGGGVA